MLKKVLLGVLGLIVVLSIGLVLTVRAVFAGDTVRLALAEQLSKALGQPVTVGSIAATAYPRVTVNLGQVSIGEPASIHVETLHVGADFGALLSRRIEHARLELSGARVELPLPAFATGTGTTSSSGSSRTAPVELVSIDAIVLRGVQIVSGGHTLTGDVEVVPEGRGLKLQKGALMSDGDAIDVTGRITNLSGPVGEVAIHAGVLNIDRLLAFANNLASGTGRGPTPSAPPVPAPATAPNAGSTRVPPMDLAISLDANRASIGQLTLDRLSGQARITSDSMTLEPIRFGVFGGRYDGSLAFTLGARPAFKLNAILASVNMADATAFAGSPGVMSGQLSGKLNLAGNGLDAASVIRAAHGTARVDIVNGSVKNLGLIRGIVIATSGRAAPVDAGGGTRDEPFTQLGTTLTIAEGLARTDDLRFESKDVVLAAGGIMRLDGSEINFLGQVQLSDELSKQAGQELVRYTQEQGRVTLSATITGSVDAPRVGIDLVSTARRALTNLANEEAQKALTRGLGGLFKR
ncbi:MAG: AsmA family protein [Acidobacteriota bacterium]